MTKTKLYKNIVVALGGKKKESKIIDQAVRLTMNLNATLSVVHVNDSGTGKPHMMMDAPESVGEKEIRAAIRKAGYGEEARHIKLRIMESNDYPDKIAEATKGADLLVIGHSHKNRFLALLIDSLDEKITDIIDCPVLIVPNN
jgi:nucleotide-binding universal stress UspA family protein